MWVFQHFRGDAPVANQIYMDGDGLFLVPGTLPIIAVVAIIFCSFFFGLATPTEAGSLGAFVVLITAFAKGMKFTQLGQALHDTAKMTVMIFTLIWGILIYARFLGFVGLPEAFENFHSRIRF